MSSTASDYDVGRLNIGIALAGIATLACITVLFTSSLYSRSTGLWISCITVLYGVMMFASSYVEEEQHFWYWVSSGWLGWVIFRE